MSRPISRLRGGAAVEGLAVGIVMLDTRFPRLPGDVGHAGTWPFPVAYRVVHGAVPDKLARPEPDPSLLGPLLDAARDLQALGVGAIITSCGFLARFQPELAEAVDVPVFSSSLLQVPLAARAAPPGKRVGILTAREVLTEQHFRGVGWSSTDIPVVQLAPAADSHFVETFVGNAAEADPEVLEAEVEQLASNLLASYPDVGAVVLECSNFAPFRATVREVTRLPVFDLYTLGILAHLTTK